jgi:hypothetical protein
MQRNKDTKYNPKHSKRKEKMPHQQVRRQKYIENVDDEGGMWREREGGGGQNIRRLSSRN